MTREEAESELMQIYGSLSEEKKMALDVLMAQEDGEHDGCKDCVYQANPQDAMPCRECKQNYMDMWKAIPSAEPKTGHWISTLATALTTNGIALNGIACSECRKVTYITNRTPIFCPWCDTDMRGDDNEISG